MKAVTRECSDCAAARLKRYLNAPGKLFLTHMVLPAVAGRQHRDIPRLAIGGTYTQARHVRAAWDSLALSAR